MFEEVEGWMCGGGANLWPWFPTWLKPGDKRSSVEVLVCLPKNRAGLCSLSVKNKMDHSLPVILLLKESSCSFYSFSLRPHKKWEGDVRGRSGCFSTILSITSKNVLGVGIFSPLSQLNRCVSDRPVLNSLFTVWSERDLIAHIIKTSWTMLIRINCPQSNDRDGWK